MGNQSAGNLSATDLKTRLRRLESMILAGNTPRELTVGSDIGTELGESVTELTVTELLKAPVYANEADIPDLETGHMAVVDNDGIYVEV